MPRPRTDEGIEEEVYRKAINFPRLGATLIHREIIGDGNLPAVRTIGEMIARARALPEVEQRRYMEVRWPESFGTADLPWEAAPHIAELRSWLAHAPTVSVAKWFYRVTLAAPGLHPAQRNVAAVWLSRADAAGDRAELRRIGERVASGDIPRTLHPPHSDGFYTHLGQTLARGLRGLDALDDASRAERESSFKPDPSADLGIEDDNGTQG
jgi:hypothetical protein